MKVVLASRGDFCSLMTLANIAPTSKSMSAMRPYDVLVTVHHTRKRTLWASVNRYGFLHDIFSFEIFIDFIKKLKILKLFFNFPRNQQLTV